MSEVSVSGGIFDVSKVQAESNEIKSKIRYLAYLLRKDDIPNLFNRINDNLDSAKEEVREVSNFLRADLDESFRKIKKQIRKSDGEDDEF
ncbi:MAG: hypothetical protein SWX82_13920 [Cyanobacteriota bacterium]|nr:hypothetical protein [Cyanobacteriota bacterium]